MKHQSDWLADQSPLKIASKGRRTGITYAEMLDATLIAAASRQAGGDNVFYIGDTKDKGREAIGYVAHFAKVVAGELSAIEEFLFEDEQTDGSTKYISAYRVRFASGFRVEALSSNPANIRGLQGIVVIDEAAFHRDVREVIDAVNALLIWGGKVRVISTHNGILNPFNELITEALAGKNKFKVHQIPFQAAVDNGLYERVCLVRGRTPTPEGKIAWEGDIRGAYGTRTAKMRQELDAIPTDAEGAALTRVMIERVVDRSVKPVRWQLGDDFKSLSKDARARVQLDFCERELKPLLDKLDPDRSHILGQDFARTGDVSSLRIYELGSDLVRRIKIPLEMRNITFDAQRDTLFYICDRLPRFLGGAIDATGNGAAQAEAAALKYGERVQEVKLTVGWYQENAGAYVEAFGDQTVTVAADEDEVRDHQALQYVGGIIKVPDDHRNKGQDGLDRHGDTAIAGMLAWYASRQSNFTYGYEPARGSDRHDHGERRSRSTMYPDLRGGL
ncbi:hypothetical protein [Fulvimarina endophytica]|nr:hypothetical protein [Fulvimarina endophytica]